MSTETTLNQNETRAESTRDRPTVTPFVDIYENQDEIMILADLPGVKRDGVSIRLDKDRLTLTASRETKFSGTPLAEEFGARDYYRAFLVPQGIDSEKITAELNQGVLRVRLPKSAALKPRRIEVRAS